MMNVARMKRSEIRGCPTELKRFTRIALRSIRATINALNRKTP
ncbi:MAG: hypothetical protein JWQ83_2167 [Lacunisphaera sp.]|nr:hypothetical protein [Lacunisphaera sp.]